MSRGDKIVALCMLRREHFRVVSVNRFNTIQKIILIFH